MMRTTEDLLFCVDVVADPKSSTDNRRLAARVLKDFIKRHSQNKQWYEHTKKLYKL